MKRKYVSLVVIGFLGNFAACQDQFKGQVMVSIIDDRNVPLPQAEVLVSVFDHWEKGEGFGKDIFKTEKLLSDSNGLSFFKFDTSRNGISILAKKNKYYPSHFSKSIFTSHSNGNWEPSGATVLIEVKKIKNPIPLIAKKVQEGYDDAVRLPSERSGYDLEVGDWVAPDGKGKTPDIFFQIDGRTTNGDQPYSSTMKVTFSNPGDGLILSKTDNTKGVSVLKMPYEAPLSGYTHDKVWKKSRKAGPTSGVNQGVDVIEDDFISDQHYFLRTRTIMDSEGKVISAHYSKVHGGFQWYVSGLVKFQYYFNPKINDRNLEFDLTQNLLLPAQDQEVTEP